VPAAEVTRDMIGAEEYDSRAAMVVRFFEDNLLFVSQLLVKTVVAFCAQS
jgi:hypothetical protein